MYLLTPKSSTTPARKFSTQVLDQEAFLMLWYRQDPKIICWTHVSVQREDKPVPRKGKCIPHGTYTQICMCISSLSSASFSSFRYDQNSPGNNAGAANTSREFRLRRAIEETDWELTAVDETDTVVGISSQLHDTINMLAVTVSCVMLMAADLKVPEDYLVWSQNYLQCIKDDEGTNPPNVQGLLSEIIKRQDPSYTPGATPKPTKKKHEGHPGKAGNSKPKRQGSKETHKNRTRDEGSDVSTLSVEKPHHKGLVR